MNLENAKYRLLIEKYKNNIYGYSFYMLRDQMEAEDITQEVSIKIWMNINKFNLLSAKSWIMKTTHNLCIDYLRKRNSKLNNECTLTDEMSDFIEDRRTKRVDEITHYTIMTDKILNLIDMLPENLKSVFILYEIEGMKYKEISKILDMPINSVKVNLLRARKKLQTELKDYERQEII